MSPDDGPLVIRELSRRVPRRSMREFLGEISRRVARGRGVVCLITDDRELRRLNRQFRGKNYATDVLSFPAGNVLSDGRTSNAGTRSLSAAPDNRFLWSRLVKNALPDGRASKTDRGSDERLSNEVSRYGAEKKPRRLSAVQADSPRHALREARGLGEIAISIDRAAAQAAEHGHSLADELRILMLHGTLHLAGFDHETDSGEMGRVEARWRKRLGLPPGLIERAPVQQKYRRASS